MHHQLGHWGSQAVGDAGHETILLRMNPGVIQWIGAFRHAQEARRLLERLVAEFGDVAQLHPAMERTVVVAIGDDIVGQGGSDARTQLATAWQRPC